MSVRLEIHVHAQDSLHRWRIRMSANRRGGDELGSTYFQMLVDELIRSGGRPAGAKFADSLSPEVGLWKFQYRGTWVVFIRRVSGGWWARLLGKQDVLLTLVMLLDHLPQKAELTSLAKKLSPRASTLGE